jgi:type I restriction enzyme R subunit
LGHYADFPSVCYPNPDIKDAFMKNPNWLKSEKEYRAIYQEVMLSVLAEASDMESAALITENLLALLEKAYRI